MLSIKDAEKLNQIKMLSIEASVPQEHLLRKAENALDFSFIYDGVKSMARSRLKTVATIIRQK